MAEANRVTSGRFIVNLLITICIFPAIILVSSGDWFWVEGWLFSLWFEAMILSNMIYLYLCDPALLAERSKLPGSE